MFTNHVSLCRYIVGKKKKKVSWRYSVHMILWHSSSSNWKVYEILCSNKIAVKREKKILIRKLKYSSTVNTVNSVHPRRPIKKITNPRCWGVSVKYGSCLLEIWLRSIEIDNWSGRLVKSWYFQYFSFLVF